MLSFSVRSRGSHKHYLGMREMLDQIVYIGEISDFVKSYYIESSSSNLTVKPPTAVLSRADSERPLKQDKIVIRMNSM